MKQYFLILAGCLWLVHGNAQPKKYTTANAHSHNDYAQARPFYMAYEKQFGSIEADIFSVPGSDILLVGHEEAEIRNHPRTLDSLYLLPLVKAIESNNGFPYADRFRYLQLMIDIKTGTEETMDKLLKSLSRYPAITGCRFVDIVISGNRPAPDKYSNYPFFNLRFDGNLPDTYPSKQLKYIGMISSSFATYSKWNGTAEFPAVDSSKLKSDINRAHAAGKKVRLWSVPDVPAAWNLLIKLGVDYINTDKISELASFLDQQQ
jgi:alkaline phosphatase